MDLQELERDELVSSDGETELHGSDSADDEGEGEVVDDFNEEAFGMREPDVQHDIEFEEVVVDQERGEEDVTRTDVVSSLPLLSHCHQERP